MNNTVLKIIGYNEELKPYGLIDDHKIIIDQGILGEEYKISYDDNYRVIKAILINPSNNRVVPNCAVYNKCGGCSFLHIKYEEQLNIKKRYLEELFYNGLGKRYPINSVIGMEKPCHYRNKNHLVVSSIKGKLVTGFYEEDSHNVIQYDDCYIQDEVANKISKTIKELLIKYHYEPYDEDRRRGLIRHIIIKKAIKTNQTMIVMVIGQRVFPGSNNFIKELINKVPSITTVIQNVNDRNTSYLLGNESKVLYGKGFIIDELLGLKFKISPRSFYQINPIQCEKLYSEAIKLARFNSTNTIMDAYSGIGTIGMCFSSRVKKVISVELVKDAYVDACTNVKLNNLHNIDLYCADATDFIKELAKMNTSIDGIILDPPRSGTNVRFINAVKRLKPKTVIYISCNPVTLVRDLKDFLDMYNIKTIQPVDMFPHTNSLETIVLLTRK